MPCVCFQFVLLLPSGQKVNQCSSAVLFFISDKKKQCFHKWYSIRQKDQTVRNVVYGFKTGQFAVCSIISVVASGRLYIANKTRLELTSANTDRSCCYHFAQGCLPNEGLLSFICLHLSSNVTHSDPWMKLKSSWSQAQMFSLSVNKTEVKMKKPTFVFVVKIGIFFFFSVDSKNRIRARVVTSFCFI